VCLAIDENGALRPSCRITFPCCRGSSAVAVDFWGRSAYVSNTDTANVSAFYIGEKRGIESPGHWVAFPRGNEQFPKLLGSVPLRANLADSTVSGYSEKSFIPATGCPSRSGIPVALRAVCRLRKQLQLTSSRRSCELILYSYPTLKERWRLWAQPPNQRALASLFPIVRGCNAINYIAVALLPTTHDPRP
jgi:hypothetical protein